MNFSEVIDKVYLPSQGLLFKSTEKKPESAHSALVHFLRTVYRLKTYKLFEKKSQPSQSKISVSNAAGFNKNAEIPPILLQLLGFDRVVIGSVCKEKWNGNKKPRCFRFSKTHSVVNWLGLPGVGAKAVRNYLYSYRKEKSPPITLNIAPTPVADYQIQDEISDLVFTIQCFADFEIIDRVELNISCPNTLKASAIDKSPNFQSGLRNYLDSIVPVVQKTNKKLHLKISPDMNQKEILQMLEVIANYPVESLTACNTTIQHNPNWIEDSPGIGGASGEAVYYLSKEIQETLIKHKTDSLQIIACGGINSKSKVQHIQKLGIQEIQLYTPLIFQGFSLIEQLKAG